MGSVDEQSVKEDDVCDAEVVAVTPSNVEYENRRFRIGGVRWWWAVVKVSLAIAGLSTASVGAAVMITSAFFESEPLTGVAAGIAAACFAYPALVLYRSAIPVLLRTSDRFEDPKTRSTEPRRRVRTRRRQ